MKRVRPYECSLWYHPRGKSFDPQGRPLTAEVVAYTAGAARMDWWRSLRDAWPEVKLTQIRVRSLAKRRGPAMKSGFKDRMKTANEIIRIIGSHGRRFLSVNSDLIEPVVDPFFARFWIDKMGELWLEDSWTRRDILVRHLEWSGFTGGGTLRRVVEELRDFIMNASRPRIFVTEHWGYGADVATVNEKIREVLS